MFLLFGILNLAALVLSADWNNMGYGYEDVPNGVDNVYQPWMMNNGNQGGDYNMYNDMMKPNTGYSGNWDYIFKDTGFNNNGYFGNVGNDMGGYHDNGADIAENAYVNSGYGNDNDGYFDTGSSTENTAY